MLKCVKIFSSKLSLRREFKTLRQFSFACFKLLNSFSSKCDEFSQNMKCSMTIANGKRWHMLYQTAAKSFIPFSIHMKPNTIQMTCVNFFLLLSVRKKLFLLHISLKWWLTSPSFLFSSNCVFDDTVSYYYDWVSFRFKTFIWLVLFCRFMADSITFIFNIRFLACSFDVGGTSVLVIACYNLRRSYVVSCSVLIHVDIIMLCFTEVPWITDEVWTTD